MDGVRQPQQPHTAPEPRNPETNTAPPPEEEEETSQGSGGGKPSGLSITSAGFLIGAAILFDGLVAVIGVITGLTVILTPLGIAFAWVINIFAGLTFFLWLHSLGLSMIKKGGGAGFSKSPWPFLAGGAVIEFIPGLNMLPGWTATIFAIIMRERTSKYLSNFMGGGEKKESS